MIDVVKRHGPRFDTHKIPLFSRGKDNKRKISLRLGDIEIEEELNLNL